MKLEYKTRCPNNNSEEECVLKIINPTKKMKLALEQNFKNNKKDQKESFYVFGNLSLNRKNNLLFSFSDEESMVEVDYKFDIYENEQILDFIKNNFFKFPKACYYHQISAKKYNQIVKAIIKSENIDKAIALYIALYIIKCNEFKVKLHIEDEINKCGFELMDCKNESKNQLFYRLNDILDNMNTDDNDFSIILSNSHFKEILENIFPEECENLLKLYYKIENYLPYSYKNPINYIDDKLTLKNSEIFLDYFIIEQNDKIFLIGYGDFDALLYQNKTNYGIPDCCEDMVLMQFNYEERNYFDFRENAVYRTYDNYKQIIEDFGLDTSNNNYNYKDKDILNTLYSYKI